MMISFVADTLTMTPEIPLRQVGHVLEKLLGNGLVKTVTRKNVEDFRRDAFQK